MLRTAVECERVSVQFGEIVTRGFLRKKSRFCRFLQMILAVFGFGFFKSGDHSFALSLSRFKSYTRRGLPPRPRGMRLRYLKTLTNERTARRQSTHPPATRAGPTGRGRGAELPARGKSPRAVRGQHTKPWGPGATGRSKRHRPHGGRSAWSTQQPPLHSPDSTCALHVSEL